MPRNFDNLHATTAQRSLLAREAAARKRQQPRSDLSLAQENFLYQTGKINKTWRIQALEQGFIDVHTGKLVAQSENILFRQFERAWIAVGGRALASRLEFALIHTLTGGISREKALEASLAGMKIGFLLGGVPMLIGGTGAVIGAGAGFGAAAGEGLSLQLYGMYKGWNLIKHSKDYWNVFQEAWKSEETKKAALAATLLGSGAIILLLEHFAPGTFAPKALLALEMGGLMTLVNRSHAFVKEGKGEMTPLLAYLMAAEASISLTFAANSAMNLGRGALSLARPAITYVDRALGAIRYYAHEAHRHSQDLAAQKSLELEAEETARIRYELRLRPEVARQDEMIAKEFPDHIPTKEEYTVPPYKIVSVYGDRMWLAHNLPGEDNHPFSFLAGVYEQYQAHPDQPIEHTNPALRNSRYEVVEARIIGPSISGLNEIYEQYKDQPDIEIFVTCVEPQYDGYYKDGIDRYVVISRNTSLERVEVPEQPVALRNSILPVAQAGKDHIIEVNPGDYLSKIIPSWRELASQGRLFVFRNGHWERFLDDPDENANLIFPRDRFFIADPNDDATPQVLDIAEENEPLIQVALDSDQVGDKPWTQLVDSDNKATNIFAAHVKDYQGAQVLDVQDHDIGQKVLVNGQELAIRGVGDFDNNPFLRGMVEYWTERLGGTVIYTCVPGEDGDQLHVVFLGNQDFDLNDLIAASDKLSTDSTEGGALPEAEWVKTVGTNTTFPGGIRYEVTTFEELIQDLNLSEQDFNTNRILTEAFKYFSRFGYSNAYEYYQHEMAKYKLLIYQWYGVSLEPGTQGTIQRVPIPSPQVQTFNNWGRGWAEPRQSPVRTGHALVITNTEADGTPRTAAVVNEDCNNVIKPPEKPPTPEIPLPKVDKILDGNMDGMEQDDEARGSGFPAQVYAIDETDGGRIISLGDTRSGANGMYNLEMARERIQALMASGHFFKIVVEEPREGLPDGYVPAWAALINHERYRVYCVWRDGRWQYFIDRNLTVPLPDANDGVGDIVNWKPGECFLAGTKITLASGRQKNIEDINIGDQVKAYNEKLNKIVASRVERIFNHPNPVPVYLKITIGTKKISRRTIQVTPNHSFWLNNREWVQARLFKVGDTLRTLSGKQIKIVKIEKATKPVHVYNFSVATYHNYIAQGVVVHNDKKEPPPPPCFLAGTSITLANKTCKNIENIKLGDKVLAFDEKSLTINPSVVTRIFKHPQTKGYLILTIGTGKCQKTLRVTPNHPLWVNNKTWCAAGDIKIGDTLRTLAGRQTKVMRIEKNNATVTTYNFEVQSYHTYIAEKLVTHNKGTKPPGPCFLAGTSITLANKTCKNIENIKLGDKVLAFDEKSLSIKPSVVTRIFKHPQTKGYLLLTIGTGKYQKTLRVTPNHPLWVNNKTWCAAEDIKIGDTLRTLAGRQTKVMRIEKNNATVTTYNFEVQSYHTYIAEKLIAHNKGSKPPG